MLPQLSHRWKKDGLLLTETKGKEELWTATPENSSHGSSGDLWEVPTLIPHQDLVDMTSDFPMALCMGLPQFLSFNMSLARARQAISHLWPFWYLPSPLQQAQMVA